MHQPVHMFMYLNITKFVITRADDHGISQLLIIAKLHNIDLFIVKDNIMVNKQNWLIAHP